MSEVSSPSFNYKETMSVRRDTEGWNHSWLSERFLGEKNQSKETWTNISIKLALRSWLICISIFSESQFDNIEKKYLFHRILWILTIWRPTFLAWGTENTHSVQLWSSEIEEGEQVTPGTCNALAPNSYWNELSAFASNASCLKKWALFPSASMTERRCLNWG